MADSVPADTASATTAPPKTEIDFVFDRFFAMELSGDAAKSLPSEELAANEYKKQVEDAVRRSRISFRNGTIVPFPPFSLSEAVEQALGPRQYAEHFPLFLTRPTKQRYPAPQPGWMRRVKAPEYNVLQFKAGDIDEIHLRTVAHHDIFYANACQWLAEWQLKKQGFTVNYAMNDANFTVVMRFLLSRPEYMDCHYDPDDLADPAVGVSKPYYLRMVEDITVVNAYKALTGPMSLIGVTDKEGAKHIAVARITKILGPGGELEHAVDFDEAMLPHDDLLERLQPFPWETSAPEDAAHTT